MEANPYQHNAWLHEPADAFAGVSTGYVTEESGLRLESRNYSNLLDTSSNFSDPPGIGVLDPAMFEPSVDGACYSSFVNELDSQL